MRRGTLKAFVDALLFVCFVNSAFTGVLLGFFIGKGPNARLPKVLWGLSRHEWGDAHLWFSLGMAGLAAAHLALQTPWMRAMSKQLTRLHWGAALLLLLALSAGALYGAARGTRLFRSEARLEPQETDFSSPRKRGRGGARARREARGGPRAPGSP